jgi:futalosine hydrolase
MRILICAATASELALLNKIQWSPNFEIILMTHGVGILQATYAISEYCNSKPDLIIQCGIAGSYDSQLPVGSVIAIRHDQIGDCGAEDQEEIMQMNDFPFFNSNEFPFVEGKLINPNNFKLDLPYVNAITVNLCAGNSTTIQYRKNTFNVQLESMEGAALHYVCLKKEIPFIQIRGVSNFIEPRNKENWNIELAIKNYSKAIIEFIKTLNE